jgi:hypothetical protein
MGTTFQHHADPASGLIDPCGTVADRTEDLGHLREILVVADVNLDHVPARLLLQLGGSAVCDRLAMIDDRDR